MNAHVHISSTSLQLSKLAVEAEGFADRLLGIAGLIERLAASRELIAVGLKGYDCYAAKRIATRVAEFSECWQIVAKHIHTPWLPVDQTDLSIDAASYSLAGLNSGIVEKGTVGSLLEVHAAYLSPCIQMYRALVSEYGSGSAGEDGMHTYEAAVFIEDEFKRLDHDISAVEMEFYDAWNLIEQEKEDRRCA